MRQKDEEELETEDMVETYDVDKEADGGLPGMDQHKPPPQPKYLSEEERKTLIQAIFAQLEPGGKNDRKKEGGVFHFRH